MLTNLYISNIVLIEKLNIEFSAGLNILTGETGAGKSILLDALALALGARSDTSLIRHGCSQATITAEFDTIGDNLHAILNDNGIDADGQIIIRRTLAEDGKSRAWINDVPVSIKLLKQVGDELVEIHGQFANHALLNPQTHSNALDQFALSYDKKYSELLNKVKNAYTEYHLSEKHLKDLQELLKKSESERDFLQHNISELQKLNVKIGEEEYLTNRRTILMNAEKDSAILKEAINVLTENGENLDAKLFSAAHILQRIKTEPNPYQEQIDTLYDIGQSISDITDKLKPNDDIDIEDLDALEERLFTIRAMARKHRVTADELPKKLEDMLYQLNTIDNSDAELKKTKADVEEKEKIFQEYSNQLSIARKQISDELRNKILSELPDLKLGQADFLVEITETLPSGTGKDNVLFMIKTNPGMPFAPLNKAASGGELARLMLALRVVLSNKQSWHTFIFDEVDTGISGSTASAVGLRLNNLSKNSQTIVITHSAQVAGFADKHFKIEKISDAERTVTTVSEILGQDRLNEIARIISGAEITQEAIATAKTLIKS